ncbi:MAG: MBL fold metallo-hydrolase [Steroidobacteraceae bacterium]
MKSRLRALLAAGLLLICPVAWSQLEPGSLNVRWNEGAQDCAASPQAPLQVHAYNARTFILRENLCATFEAPFLYLLVGAKQALLIDTGDVADPKAMPLAHTVLGLLPAQGSSKLPLLVVHTHRHLDHRAGDPQFERLPNVQVVGFDLGSVRRFFGFAGWPEGLARIDLGGRTVDVLPTPGHNETHVSFYDRNTGLFFSGDFLMPGRLIIDDADADLASANRVANFITDRPVSHVLGGHIEMNLDGATFPWESQYHPRERPLPMRKEDLLELPAAIAGFNGFYTRHAGLLLTNPIHNLLAGAAAVVIVLVTFGVWLFRYLRHRRAARNGGPAAADTPKAAL